MQYQCTPIILKPEVTISVNLKVYVSKACNVRIGHGDISYLPESKWKEPVLVYPSC